MSVLVYGECGVGKSTFIKECTGQAVNTGRSIRGVTKTVQVYGIEQKYDLDLGLVDCPGVGDIDIPFPAVLDELAETFPCGSFVAVIIVISGSNPRFTLALQLVAKLLSLAFKSSLNWHDNVVVVATNWDVVEKTQGEDDIAETREAVKEIAELISKEAKIGKIPDEQIFHKRLGQEQDIREVVGGLKSITSRPLLKFSVPSVVELDAAVGEVFLDEEMKKQYLDDYKRKRRAECLKRLEVSVESGMPDRLKYILSALDIIFETVEEKRQLDRYKKVAAEWEDEFGSSDARSCQSSHDESHFRDEGNVVRARVFSQSADAWVSGEVTQFFEDNFVRIEYKVGDYWHRKTLHLLSEQLDMPSAERHTLM